MSSQKSDLILRLDEKIPSYDVSLNGQTKFYTLCNILLDSAAVHANKFRFGYHDMRKENVYWVLSRFHIIMHEYPRYSKKSVGDAFLILISTSSPYIVSA